MLCPFLCGVACLALTHPAAAPADSRATVLRVSSHFHLATAGGPLPDRLQREALVALEDWHRRFLVRFGIEPDAPVDVVFHPADRFHRQTGAPPWADGVYGRDGLIRIATGGMSRLEPDLERVLAHELAHAFITVRSGGHAPRWLQEGLAQRLSASPTARGFPRPPNPSDLDHAGALAFTVALADQAGDDALIDVLRELQQGADIEAAFRRATGTGLQIFYRRWIGGKDTSR